MKIDLKKDYKFWIILALSVVGIWVIGIYNIKMLKLGYLDTNALNLDIEHLQSMYGSVTNSIIVLIVMLIIVAILSALAIKIYYSKKLTPEKLFWYIIPTICIMFLVFMPAFKSHDEAFHWFRIQDMSQGNLLTEVRDNKPLADLKEYIYKATNLIPENISYNYILSSLYNGDVNKEETVTVELGTTSIYNPIQYMPQTVRSSFNKNYYRQCNGNGICF